MASKLFYLPFLPVFAARGLPSPGAKAYFYQSGTSNPALIYANSALTTPLANPVVADSIGRLPDIYLNDALVYRLVIKDADGVELDEVDPYIPGTLTMTQLTQDQIDALMADVNEARDDAEDAATAAEAAAEDAANSLAQFYTLSEIAKFVNPFSGLDTNAGTIASPYKTIEQGIAQTTNGQYIGLKKDGNFPTAIINSGSTTGNGTPAKGFVGYGAGVYNPVIDARQKLNTLTWTQVGGSTVRWQATVTFRGSTVAGSINSAATTNYRLWYNDEALEWKYSGVDIAANQALVEAAPGSWTINMVGQTAPDPRTGGVQGAAGQTYTVTVHMPLGQNPNGMDVRIADQPSAYSVVGGLFDAITIFGTNGKDSSGSQADVDVPFTLLRNYKNTEFGAHGWVGPVNIQGDDNIFIGRVVEGSTGTASSNGRSLGGAINIFTAVDYTTRNVELEGTITLKNCTTGLYGHGSGNRGYENINGENVHLIVDNCNTAIKLDSAAGNSFIKTEVRIGRVTGTNVDNFYVQGADPLWKIGNTTTASSAVSGANATSTKTLVTFEAGASGSIAHIINHDFKMDGPMEAPSFTLNLLAQSNVSDASPAPRLIIDNCRDTQTIVGGARPRNKAILQKTTISGASWYRIHLEIRNGSVLGSLSSMATPDFAPESLTVDAGCTFGWGDMTGPQIETLMTSLGKTHSISHQTTIVNRAGAVVSAPGW